MNFWLTFLIICQTKVLVLSQAPGDQDTFCTTPSDSITPPSYPPNTIILMDSYNYIRLLSSRFFSNGGVWQQVDVDGVIDVNNNNAPTNWLQPTSSTCRETVSSCYFNLAPPSQNNWLITQHISRELNGSLLPQVSVQVEFQLTGCDAGCQRSFLLEVWETSDIDPVSARNTTQYRRIQKVATDSDSGLQTQNASIPVNFNTNESGFYLAFVDDNTCIAITRVIVFYYVCPAMVQDLVVYPETLSPPINTLQPQTKHVQGHCVEKAVGELSGRNPSLPCIQTGIWGSLQPGTGCQCQESSVAMDSNNSCTGCPAGEYASPANSSCQACPANTRVDEVDVAACPCLDGYFRAPGQDGDFSCTGCPAGKYFSPVNGTCQACRSGEYWSPTSKSCQACPAGEYLSPANISCRACPANTRVDEVGVAVCSCVYGYYRSPGEDGDFPYKLIIESTTEGSHAASQLYSDSTQTVVYSLLSTVIALYVMTLLADSSFYISTTIEFRVSAEWHQEM